MDADRDVQAGSHLGDLHDASQSTAEGIASSHNVQTRDNHFSTSNVPAFGLPPSDLASLSDSTNVASMTGSHIFTEWRERTGDDNDDGDHGDNVDSLAKGIEMLNGDPLYQVCDGMTNDMQRIAANAHAASQNSGAGRQKKHTVYCTASMGIHVGCQSELPALQGHGNGEKVTKCNNFMCAWYNTKQVFDANDQFLRFCTIPRGPYKCGNCGNYKHAVDGVPHWMVCPNKTKKGKGVPVAEEDKSEELLGAPLTSTMHEKNRNTLSEKDKQDDVTTDMLAAMNDSGAVEGNAVNADGAATGDGNWW